MVSCRGVIAFDHTQGHTTVGWTPLDDGSARRRDLYLTTHNTHNRQTSMPPAGFEPANPADDRAQTLALDRSATGIGSSPCYVLIFSELFCHTHAATNWFFLALDDSVMWLCSWRWRVVWNEKRLKFSRDVVGTVFYSNMLRGLHSVVLVCSLLRNSVACHVCISDNLTKYDHGLCPVARYACSLWKQVKFCVHNFDVVPNQWTAAYTNKHTCTWLIEFRRKESVCARRPK